MRVLRLVPLAVFGLIAVACGSDSDTPTPGGTTGVESVSGTQAAFDLNFDTSSPDAFFNFPYPSDLRLTAEGTPDVAAFPNPSDKATLAGLIVAAGQRPGFPTVSNAYFRFDGVLPALDRNQLVAASLDSPIFLVDIDGGSPDRGKLFPVTGANPNPDPWVPENLLALSPMPGVVLVPERSYAYVVMRSLGDGAGALLGSSLEFEQVKQGQAPAGDKGARLVTLYEPLWETLSELEVSLDNVAAATVFRVEDVVKETSALTDAMVEVYDVELLNLRVDPTDGADHDRYCEILGEVSFPQFQQGAPPFRTEGLFELGADGLPVKQREETAKIVLTFPRQPMPAEGYPLVMYFHGSGGIASQVVDRGTVTVLGEPPPAGEGPAHVLAAHGFGAVGSSHPMSPDRVPEAGDIAYLNFANLAATRDIFRQGIVEQRLFLEALTRLKVDPALVAACTGMSLPSGETEYHYAAGPVLAMGQSMGGMYTNLIGAVEPRIEAVVPTGAGGYWSYFIEETSVVNGLPSLAGTLLGSPEELDRMHPAIHMFQTAWEAAEPIVYIPRLAQRPLDGHPIRAIYEPVAPEDQYFSTNTYDAFAIASGNQQIGEEVWPTMQQKMAVVGQDGLGTFPASNNRTCRDGTPYTGVIAQYPTDGLMTGHYIFAQRDDVKYQYGCFFESFYKTGTAIVPAPAALGTPCPLQ